MSKYISVISKEKKSPHNNLILVEKKQQIDKQKHYKNIFI